jgi:hypothetical protein
VPHSLHPLAQAGTVVGRELVPGVGSLYVTETASWFDTVWNTLAREYEPR